MGMMAAGRVLVEASVGRAGGWLAGGWLARSVFSPAGTSARATVWRLARHLAVRDERGCLAQLLGRPVSAATVARLFEELQSSPVLTAALDTPAARCWLQAAASRPAAELLRERLALGSAGRGRALFWYVAARLLRPDAVVETGCFSGWDSAVILEALAQNGHGRLYSVDLPLKPGQRDPRLPGGGLPPGLGPGFLVPPALRARWTLILGDVREELPPLLRRLGSIDLFFHDSDHRYTHMMWEYSTVWPHLAPGGLLVSDDISLHTALWDFAAGVGAPVVIHRTNANVGAVVRREGACR
jgi:predicted O-methyltransferase YrrM